MPAGRRDGGEVAREREPAAADVERLDVPAPFGDEAGRRVGEPADVAELEVRRVLEVDVGVAEAVEDERPAVRVAAVGNGRSMQ